VKVKASIFEALFIHLFSLGLLWHYALVASVLLLEIITFESKSLHSRRD
jgi:hypothetical protein